MHHPILIIPGFHGSGPAHWQTWLEVQLPEAKRIGGIDWESPVLARWVSAIRRGLDAASGTTWVVAHSFGCLAAVTAAAGRSEKVAGMLLVAPADPERFSPFGLRDARLRIPNESIRSALPQKPLAFPSTLVASTDDPWLTLEAANAWATRWGSGFVNVGAAGHINVDSGHGPWPLGLELLRTLQRAPSSRLPDTIDVHGSRRRSSPDGYRREA